MKFGIAVGFFCGVVRGKDIYIFDEAWNPKFPEGSHMFSGVALTPPGAGGQTSVVVTQRGNASIDPVLVMDAGTGDLIHSWGSDVIALDHKDPDAPTWGAHGLETELTEQALGEGCIPSDQSARRYRVWINDFTNCQLSTYDQCGTQLAWAGTPGVCGNATSPLQFGKHADTSTLPASPGGRASIFVTDGDGSKSNRVVRLSVPSDLHGQRSPDAVELEWATPSEFKNPHSIALHERTGLLIVADRENNQTRLLRSSDGADMGVWDCGLHLGSGGKPFGVRASPRAGGQARPDGRDVVFIGIMDNPQDGKNQKIAVVDASGLNAMGAESSKCEVLQVIDIDPSHFSGPHLLGVDDATGDLYAALVADQPRSAVLRYKLAPETLTV